MENTRAIQGEIVLPTGGPPIGSADVVICVEDISRADAPSLVIGEQRQKGLLLHPGARLPFVIEVPTEMIDERNLYSIRAHVDRSGSGVVKKGDFVSTETYPVLSRGYGVSATVKVKAV